MSMIKLVLAVWFALWSYPIVASIVGTILIFLGIEMDAHRTIVHYISSHF